MGLDTLANLVRPGRPLGRHRTAGKCEAGPPHAEPRISGFVARPCALSDLPFETSRHPLCAVSCPSGQATAQRVNRFTCLRNPEAAGRIPGRPICLGYWKKPKSFGSDRHRGVHDLDKNAHTPLLIEPIERSDKSREWPREKAHSLTPLQVLLRN
jgi:hypothetical protein